MAYTTSKEYEKIIYSGEATENRIRIWFNEVELEDADNYCEKLSASSRLLPSSSSNRFSLDNFVSKELTLILHEVSLDKIVDQVKISLGTLVNGEYEDIPLGVFNIQDKPITDKDKITIKLRDNAIKFDFNYNAKPIIDSNGGSATKLQIFKDICSKAGVKTKVTSFANSSDLIGIYDNTIKARAYIYYLAEQCGAIPTIDRDGELIFVYINNLKVQRIPLSSIEKFEIGNKYRISKVIYEDAIRKYQSGNDDYDKLFLNSANPYISNQNQVNSIGSVVNGFEIDSLKTGKVLGNPAIDPYDIIEIYDDENNEELIIARTLANYSLTYNGVITNIYDTQIGLEARKENVSVNSEPTFKKWATTEINNLDASIKLSAGKISTLEEKTNTQTEQINSLELTATSTTSKISNIEKDLSTTNQNLSDLEKEIQGVSVDFEDFKDTEYAETIQNIQDQLDGAIQFWSGTETPTLNNFPANQWTTEALKNEHQGDIYDVLEGETIVSSYKFIKIDGVYEWRIMSDSEISAVKQLAQEALSKANQNKSDIEVINGSVTELQQTDKEIKASVSEIKTEVVPTGQASGSNIHITDSADAELLDFKLYGKSTQETRSGKNIITGLRSSSNTYINYNIDTSKLTNQMTYSFIAPFDATSVVVYIRTVSSAGIFSKGTINIVSNQRTSFTFELTDDEIQALQNENSFIQLYKAGAQWGTPTLEEPQLENGATTTEYEIYGAMPSPDYPSEIENVGYTNLFDKDSATYKNNYLKNDEGAESSTNISGYLTSYIPIEPNEKYTIKGSLKVTSDANSLWRLYFYDKNKNWISRTSSISQNPPYTFTTPDNAYFMQFQYIISVFDAETIQVEKGEIAHPYIPFGKYGVEVNINNDNLFNYEDTTSVTGGITTDENGWITITYDNTNGTSTKYLQYYTNNLDLKTSTTYAVVLEVKNVSGTGRINPYSTNTSKTEGQFTTSNPLQFTSLSNNNIKVFYPTTYSNFDAISKTRGIRTLIAFSNGESGSITFRISVLEDTTTTADNFIYKPYVLTPTLIQSDYPLMSNKDETIKDYVYLQNGNLYLKKYINEIILDGSNDENWNIQSINSYGIANFIITNLGILYASNVKPIYSNYFENQTTTIANTQTEGIMNSNITSLYIRIKSSTASTVEQFKTWLSENNVKVQYELAEPQDILIAENVDSLITYKNVTNISTNDELQPNMEVVYVKDNTLNDIYQTQNGMNKYYTKVENDAQLEIVSDEIKSSVTEINTTIDTIRGAIETINQTMLTQTADQFEMLFKQTGIKELVDSVDALTKSNNATLVEQEQWIRFKGGNIELGRSDSQVKLLLSNDKISFLTGGNESAYISNNQLYITDSTILNKLQVGHWETKEENGNLNTRWIEGVI